MLVLASVLAAGCTAVGVAVGKAWGSYGKQTTILCNVAREACRETMAAKLDSLVSERNARLDAIMERLRRIEQLVLNNRGKHD